MNHMHRSASDLLGHCILCVYYVLSPLPDCIIMIMFLLIIILLLKLPVAYIKFGNGIY